MRRRLSFLTGLAVLPGVRAKVFSIRIYNWLLTPMERAHNLAVDRMRFLCEPEVHTVLLIR